MFELNVEDKTDIININQVHTVVQNFIDINKYHNLFGSLWHISIWYSIVIFILLTQASLLPLLDLNNDNLKT